MRLRVTEESETYVYATSTLNFGGLAKEDLVLLMFPMALGSTASLSPLLSFGAGIFSLWLYKKVTSGKPEGFLVLYCSASLGGLCNVPLIKQTPFLLKLSTGLVKAVDQLWITSGLLPSPSYCNLYER